MRNKDNIQFELPARTRDQIRELAKWDHRTMKGEIIYIVEEYRKAKGLP